MYQDTLNIAIFKNKSRTTSSYVFILKLCFPPRQCLCPHCDKSQHPAFLPYPPHQSVLYVALTEASLCLHVMKLCIDRKLLIKQKYFILPCVLNNFDLFLCLIGMLIVILLKEYMYIYIYNSCSRPGGVVSSKLGSSTRGLGA